MKIRFWQQDYKSSEDCKPCVLDYDSIIRWDNVILYTKEQILDICSKCESKEDCVQLLRQAKTDLYSKKK